MPIPAVTLKHNTTHESQNCGVLIALLADTCPTVTSEPTVDDDGVHPCGFQSCLGTRTSNHPSDMNTAFNEPVHQECLGNARRVGAEDAQHRGRSRRCDQCAAAKAHDRQALAMPAAPTSQPSTPSSGFLKTLHEYAAPTDR